MSNVKISELPVLNHEDVVPLSDVLAIVNTQETKQITVSALLNGYAKTTHNHDTDYAAATHNHDTDYAAATHNHDADYAALNHNHDADYAALNHNHNADYAAIDHTHDLQSLSNTNIPESSQLQNEDVIKWNDSQQKWTSGQVLVDVDTSINSTLRGTDNPHIGAYPKQSFKVADNPKKSVMVITDADGNLDFLVKTEGANIFLNTPSARKAASFGFSVVEDSSEPDIEVLGTLGGSAENYSVISGDSDTKGVNGLPIRQGFNNPDIGANPTPILISGGTIA